MQYDIEETLGTTLKELEAPIFSTTLADSATGTVSLGERVWSVIFWLLTPFLFLFRQALTLIVWVDVRYFHDAIVSPRAKCPSCGIRQVHSIQYAEDYQCVIHTCGLCKAEWGQAPVVPATKWQIKRMDEPQSGGVNYDQV